MDDDLVAAEALQLEEVLRLSAHSCATACAVCRQMIISVEASWKPENCDHVICIDCFATHTTEAVATEVPKCPVATCKYHFEPQIPEVMDVDDDVLREVDQCSSSTPICAVCRLMIVSLEASWKPENCDHVICIACFAIHTSESSKCPVASCGTLLQPEVIDAAAADDGGASSSTSVRVMDKGKGKEPGNAMLQEFGESSSSWSAMTVDEFYCTICMEEMPTIECFPVGGCTHTFCVSCVRQYVAAKVEENVLSIGCPDPGCKDGSLHPEECRDVIPTPLFQRWGAALCDMAFGTLKLYCPFNDCSKLLINDDHRDGDAAITDAECPHCSRMFCARCKVPWHDGVDCAEFQRLGEDERGREDLLLRKVAQTSKWQRCPKCKMYVERVEGCVYIVCRYCVPASLKSPARQQLFCHIYMTRASCFLQFAGAATTSATCVALQW
jgi:E3 ubiquitin-protein ligase RNF144